MPFRKNRKAMERVGLGKLPYWPRMLNADQAASFLGITPEEFAEHVTMEPVKLGRRRLFHLPSLIMRYFDPHTLERRNLPPENEDWIPEPAPKKTRRKAR